MSDQEKRKMKDFNPYGDTQLAQNFINLLLVLSLSYIVLSTVMFISSYSLIENIHKLILQGVKPNLTFVLKVSVLASKKRLQKRRTKNRYDNFSQSFYTKAQESFLKIAKNKKNYIILESSKNDSILEKKIFKIVSKFLGIK